LEEDASDISYATFLGGSQSTEHSDGGMSRFDENGNLYLAVCAGCGGNSDFPTTNGAWSNVNESALQCNTVGVRFNLSGLIANPQFEMEVEGSPIGCYNKPIQFINNDGGTGATTYNWDFGDGNSSMDESPSHLYGDTGTYEVKLVVTNPVACPDKDSATFILRIDYPDTLKAWATEDTICIGETVELVAIDAGSYLWSPGSSLDDSTKASVFASPLNDISYTVVGTNICGPDTAEVNLVVLQTNFQLPNDTTICIGESIVLDPKLTDGNFIWQDNSTSSTYTAYEAGIYWLNASIKDCPSAIDSVIIDVKNCAVIIEMPNIFSPNGDGFNDYFAPESVSGLNEVYISVYNRWGKKLFTSDNILVESNGLSEVSTTIMENGWDGQFKGENSPEGTYFWLFHGIDNDNNEYKKQGSLTLKR